MKTLDELINDEKLADDIIVLLLELKAYREGGITEEILRRNDGYIKVGKGCVIALEERLK